MSGQIFFVSSHAFIRGFDFTEDRGAGRDRVHARPLLGHLGHLGPRQGRDEVPPQRESSVELIGLNEASSTMIDRLAIHDKPGALERLMQH